MLEKQGLIWVVQSNSVLSQPFLNITNHVVSGQQEQGLLSMAFPPGFSTNGHFYVSYTRQSDSNLVVSRFQLTSNTNQADPNSEQVILAFSQVFPDHYGGDIVFGPDGYLYIGKGDGGYDPNNGIGDPYTNAQNTAVLLGKLLRIDTESGVTPYAIPPGNPFVGVSNCAPEIWAYGLRNPWRFSFDRQTGNLYIADVGHFEYEEVDFQSAGSVGGQNYGWRIMEGPSNYIVPPGFTNFASLTDPVAWYAHDLNNSLDGTAAVIGGYVCRAPVTTRMNGIYFYGDFATGAIYGLTQTGANWTNVAILPYTGEGPNFTISTFGEDDSGNLYMADISAGKIYQLLDSGQAWTPTFSPSGGVINNNLVTVNCLTTNAAIHYTAGTGIAPTTSDPLIPTNGIIQVTPGTIYEIRAFRADLTASGVSSATFTLQVGTPVFTPPAGPITNATPVSIAAVTPGATIYYTTNGTTPTTNSAVYTVPLVLSGGVTLKALGVAGGYSNSAVASAVYSAAQVATPVYTPGSGPITNGTSIAISCATPGSIIYYSIDGSSPTTNSPVYQAPFPINGGVTVNSFATAAGYQNSAIQSTLFTLVQTATPVFLPSSGPITNSASITVTCATSGAQIFYTVDGTTPTTNSQLYMSPITIGGDTTLNAIAVASNHLNSAVESVFYTLSDYKYPCVVTTLAGSGTVGYSNATGILAEFYSPQGVCVDAGGNVYVADTGNNLIRKIAPSGAVTTLAGITSAGFQNGSPATAQFSSPVGICADTNGNVYVADSANYCIRKIDTNGNVSTFSGNGIAGYQNGPAATSEFLNLCFLASDGQSNLYAGDWGRVRIIYPDGSAQYLAGSGINSSYDLGGWVGLCVNASDTVYAASEYGRVFQISPAGVMNLFAGSSPGYNDGPAAGAEFSQYYPLARDTAVDASGNVYVGDNSQIRVIDTNGWVSTLAGSTVSGNLNGNGQAALFGVVSGLCFDSRGNLFVADAANNCIRKISLGAPGQPTLQIGPAPPGQLALSWPLWAAKYTLETSSSLSPNATWTPVTNGVQALVNNYLLTNNIGTNSVFYRLHIQ